MNGPRPIDWETRVSLSRLPTSDAWVPGAEWTFEVTETDGSRRRLVFVVTDRIVDGGSGARCVALDPPAGREAEFWFPEGCVQGRVLTVDLMVGHNHAFDFLEGEMNGIRFHGVRQHGFENDFESTSTTLAVEGWRSR